MMPVACAESTGGFIEATASTFFVGVILIGLPWVIWGDK